MNKLHLDYKRAFFNRRLGLAWKDVAAVSKLPMKTDSQDGLVGFAVISDTNSVVMRCY